MRYTGSNGYSHQNPGLIGQLLTLPSNMVRIYLPPDANTAVSVMAHCLRSKNYVNLVSLFMWCVPVGGVCVLI